MDKNINTESLDNTSFNDNPYAGMPPPKTSIREGLERSRKVRDNKDFVLPGLVRGRVGSLVSPGGTGKSWLALELSLLVASGIDILELNKGRKRPLGQGKVVYISFEDWENEVYDRLDAILDTFKIKDENVRDFDSNLAIYHSHKRDIFNDNDYNYIRYVSQGARLLILDTFSNIHNCEENATKDMTNVIDRLNRFALEFDMSIVFLHHTSKAAALNGVVDLQQSIRGSSALTDNIRYQSYVTTLSKDEYGNWESDIDGTIDERNLKRFIQYGVSKCNSEGTPEPKWLYRTNNGVLKPCTVKRINKTVSPTASGKPNKKKTYTHSELEAVVVGTVETMKVLNTAGDDLNFTGDESHE